MTIKQIEKELEDGLFIYKRSYTKWKGRKIVRGSFNDYDIGGNKITEKQFDALYDRLYKISNDGLGETIYGLKTI